jgi:hypothetical protein
MGKSTHLTLAFAASILTSLFFVAGSESFQMLPENVANLSGMVFGGIAGLLWVTYGLKKDGKDEG